MPYLPDNRQFKRRHKRVHIEAPSIHHAAHSHLLMWIGIGVLLTGGMVYLGRMVYLLDRENSSGDQMQAEIVIDELRQKITLLESERDALSQSVATLERAAQVDKEAQRQVQEELIGLQEERQQLEQELAVMKRVAGKSKGSSAGNSTTKSGGSQGGKKSSSRSSKKINKSLPSAGKGKAF